jgi:hypothetical protein
VCKRALELGQCDEVTFLPTARQYYNLILDQASRAFDWPYFRLVAANVAMVPGVREYDVPTDYKRSDTCYFVDTNGNRREILIKSKYEWDTYQKQTAASGQPQVAYIDLDQRKIVFDNSPSQTGFYYSLTYFRNPVEADDAGGNDADDVDFESPLYLIQEIAAMLLDFNDDERADGWHAKAMQTLNQLKLNSEDEDSDPKVELAHGKFRPGRRPGRGGAGWGVFYGD